VFGVESGQVLFGGVEVSRNHAGEPPSMLFVDLVAASVERPGWFGNKAPLS